MVLSPNVYEPPISVLPIISKILERLVHKQTYNYILAIATFFMNSSLVSAQIILQPPVSIESQSRYTVM